MGAVEDWLEAKKSCFAVARRVCLGAMIIVMELLISTNHVGLMNNVLMKGTVMENAKLQRI